MHLQLRAEDTTSADTGPLSGRALITLSPDADHNRLDVVALDVSTGEVATLAENVNSVTIAPR